VILYGLGPIGIGIGNLILSRREIFEIVGGIDIDPNKAGRDLGEILEAGKKLGKKIGDSLEEVLSNTECDIVIHATSSYIKTVKPQVEEILSHGIDVVSTCEELSYPYYSHRSEASDLDFVARKNGATLLATGVNPGFVMDILPLTLSGICARVDHVYVERVLDATKRRLPFQRKVGLGISVEEFNAKVEQGKIGHVGLIESSAMIVDSVGAKVKQISQTIRPKIAENEMQTENFKIQRGSVQGLVQDSTATILPDGREFVRMHLEMYAFADRPRDIIKIKGEPNISLEIPDGTPGDIATLSIVMNSIPRVLETEPGLKTVRDLRPASAIFVGAPFSP
jgi:hypothetical protein